MNPVGWFEIPVKDMDRAETFYKNIFEIQLERHEMGPLLMSWFPMDTNGKGASGSLVQHEQYTPSHEGVLIYFTAPNIDETLARVEQNNGKVLAPKKDLGEYGVSAIIEDTEGNRIGLHTAK